jgi:hypothetical protein
LEQPGTTLISDSWSSYNKINKFDFTSLTVNHKYNFVDPDSGAHTNKIEGLWSQFKRKFKGMNGCDRVQLQSHINEFMWRQWPTNDRVDAFDKILEELGELLFKKFYD